MSYLHVNQFTSSAVAFFKRVGIAKKKSLMAHFFSFLKRTYRMPKDIHVEPERFAAELISRLENVLREREAQERLEERLKRVRLVSAQRPANFPECGSDGFTFGLSLLMCFL